MALSTIHVAYANGAPARGSRVTLGFSSGLTKPVWTDGNGEALVSHASTGRCDVFVNGKRYHSFHAPGRTAVTI